MRFGRVEGFVQAVEGKGDSTFRLIVTLETNSRIETVRDELIEPTSEIAEAELCWLADQYTQETIGDILAVQGWEAIGASDLPESQTNAPARSASYAVRNLS
jgi:hypothetical protein